MNAPGIQFPEQNHALTCDDIPGCQTLYVHARADAILGEQRISCHELNEYARAEVARTGRVYVGIFGALQPPIAVYGGAFPYPVEQAIGPEDVGTRTLANVLDTAETVFEFVELWRWLHPAVKKTQAALDCYARAAARWPKFIYPLEKLKFELEAPLSYEEELTALGWLDPSKGPANWWESDQEIMLEVQIVRRGQELPTVGCWSESGQWYVQDGAALHEIDDVLGWQPLARVPEFRNPPETMEGTDAV